MAASPFPLLRNKCVARPRDRRRSTPHSAGSWQASPRPTDWNCAVWSRSMAKPCAVPSSVAGKAPRCTWSTSGQQRRDVLGSAQSSRPQRGSGGVRSPGPAGPRRLYRYRGCTALPSRLCLHGARAGCGLRAGAQENQSKLFAAAARRYARSGARSVAERREPATHYRCEWRRATVLRDTTFAAVQFHPSDTARARG